MILVSMGRFFFVFGLASFFISLVFGAVLGAMGLPVTPVMAKMSGLIVLTGIAAAVLGVFGKLGIVSRAFVPQLGQLAGVATYLAMFLPAITGIATVMMQLVQYMPAPMAVKTALATFISIVGTASMAYYIAAKLGYLPPE